jgi:signal transduction histidine kinase
VEDKSMHVLIIEDHEDVAANVSDYLEARGDTVDFAYDGLGGLHLAVTHSYDAIILDLGLPGMDGLHVCRRLRGFMVRERQFTANASHELRTPVTVIRGASELLEAQIGDREPALRKPLARIQRAVAAMEETIEVFLALARETELTELAGECCPAEIAAEVVEQHRRLLEDRPVAVVVQVPESLRIEAPPRALAIVLGNLVANAFRRTLRGSVTLKWQDEHLEVVDTGPGIPEHLADNATERHLSSGHGYGLGLSIVTALCERFGWRLELVGAPGTGARAILHL